MDNSINDEDILNVVPINKKSSSIAQEILDASSLEDTQKLVKLFNLTQAKKNVIRVLKLNELLDNVQVEIISRFEEKPELFTNGDLIDYFQVTQTAIDRANKSLNLIEDIPAVQINQVNIIKEESKLSKDSVNKVISLIQNILDGKVPSEVNEIEPKEIILDNEVDSKSYTNILNEE